MLGIRVPLDIIQKIEVFYYDGNNNVEDAFGTKTMPSPSKNCFTFHDTGNSENSGSQKFATRDQG